MTISKNDRIRGGFWGLLIGDALGVPYEFHAAENLPPMALLEMKPPASFARSYADIPPGTWSDDGAQALGLLASLLHCGVLDPEHVMEEFVMWYREGKWAVDRHRFDIGNQTRSALLAFEQGIRATDAGFAVPDGKGNGSLMRVLPLALWHAGTDGELVQDAHAQSRLTHGHICNQICCALYVLWARRLLAGMASSDAYDSAVSRLEALYLAKPAYSDELHDVIQPEQPPEGDGSGYVVASLHAARLAMQHDTYEAVVKTAIALGNDTDTNAAIAGGLAGIRDGIQGIPPRWQKKLRGRHVAARVLSRLLGREK